MKRIFWIVFAVAALLSAQTPPDSATYLSVLPFDAPALSASLTRTLADEFRKALQETGRFKVMERELMEKLLTEQAFQMTGIVDEKTAVQVGRLIGVSRLIAVSVAKTGDNTFAVSARLIDIATGSVAASASEKRSGDSFDINSRMLRNIAFALAGIETDDRREYLRLQQQELAEARRGEAVLAKRFHVNLFVNADYPVHMLQNDNEAARRAYYTATPELTGWRLPKDKFETGFSARAGYRLLPRLWLQFSTGVGAIDTRDRFASGTFQNDTTIIAGPDTTRLAGPSDILSRGYDSYSLVDFGLGLRFDLLQTPRVNLGISALPVLGYMTFHSTTFDSAFSNNNMYVNNVFMGKSQIYEETLRKYELTSACVGADLTAHADFFILRSLCLSAEAGLNVLSALSLEGTSKVRRSYLARDPSTPPGAAPSDSSYTENCAMIKGNFLGTGEYLMMANPDVKQFDPQGRSVVYEKSYREFSNFRVRIGLGYYF